MIWTSRFLSNEINVSRHLSKRICASSSVCSDRISSIGFGGGAVAIVHPIQAPIPRTAMNAMSTGMATSHSLMASRAGQKSPTM